MDMREFLKSAAHVKPSANQMAWYDTEFYGFVHFTVNTYTNLEWGLGNEPESLFNPAELDCDQWARAFQSAGMRGMVLTCKHHDGFCLWPSAYTRHSVKYSPWKGGKGDVVREASDACRRAGLKFGVYLSPWDRNSALYGTDEYNRYYRDQLTELLTGYGELFMVWFDGACGEGPNGRRQVYDYDGWIELIRKYQPNCAIFGAGSDVRWCGNEAGKTRDAEWAVVPRELAPRCPAQTKGPCLPGGLPHMDPQLASIGDLDTVLYSEGLAFCGCEVDMSIRPGWFYHENERAHSLDRLFSTYVRAVGGNACFHLNVPPMPGGRFHPDDVKRLAELGARVREAFGRELTLAGAQTQVRPAETLLTVSAPLAGRERVRRVVLEEQIAEGQRVSRFFIRAGADTGAPVVFEGTTIGHRRVCEIDAETDAVCVQITSARDTPLLKPVRAY